VLTRHCASIEAARQRTTLGRATLGARARL
jgi:hypothetical protein